MKKGVTGIIWIGPVYDMGGYGNVARNYLVGLAEIGYPVRVIPLGEKHSQVNPETTALIEKMETTDVGALPLVVAHGTPAIHGEVKAWGAASKVLCTIFETDGIPQRWAEDCNKFDEVWVPSHFNYETFSNSGVDKSKLWIIPYAIDTKLFKPAQSARPGSQPFTFLYIFSFGWRKGFDILLEAFLGEFKKGEAKLVMRAFTAGYQGVNKAQLADTLMDSVAGKVNLADPSLPEVEINDRALSADDLLKLYANSDMYISTDRANGWGVPCMEAMALGKPAATIDWSGSTEFMKADNSFLIKPEPELEPVDVRLSDAVPHLYAGQRWAKVKVETVRAVMRDAYEHPEKRERLAAKGLEDIQEHFTPSAIAKRIVQHAESLKPSWLQRLRAGLGIPPLVYLGSTRVLLKHKLRGAAKRSG